MLRYETNGLREKIEENVQEMDILESKLNAQVVLSGKHARTHRAQRVIYSSFYFQGAREVKRQKREVDADQIKAKKDRRVKKSREMWKKFRL